MRGAILTAGLLWTRIGLALILPGKVVTLPAPPLLVPTVPGLVLILPGKVVTFPVVPLLPVAGLVPILPGRVVTLPTVPLLLPPLAGLIDVPLAGSVMIFDGIGRLACAPRLSFEMPSLGEMPMLAGLNVGDFVRCVNCISGTAFGCTCSFNADLA